MSKLYVLDTGALLSNWTQQHREDSMTTTQAVMDEVRNKPSQVRTELLLLLDKMTIESASQEYLTRTEEAAKVTGDMIMVSQTDIGLVALCLEKKESGIDSILVSTDLALLNIAIYLGLDIEDPENRMRNQITWSFRCPACSHTQPSHTEYLDCPICGTPLRRYARKKRRLS